MRPPHSPGPWKTGDCDGFIIWASGFRSTAWTSHEAGPEAVVIANVHCPGWSRLTPPEGYERREAWVEECEANAALIALAPDHADIGWAMCVGAGRWVAWGDGRGEFAMNGLWFSTRLDPFGVPEITDALRAHIRRARGLPQESVS